IELSTSLSFDDDEIETTWFGGGASRSIDDLQVGGLSFLYPIPTYRGSLVFGISIDRIQNYNLAYERAGRDPDLSFFGSLDDDIAPPGEVRDRHDREGKLNLVSGAVGWDVSPRLSLGVALSVLYGSIFDEQTFTTTDTDGIDPDLASSEVYYLLDSDVTGVSGLLGVTYKASPSFRFGGVLGLPRAVELERFEQFRIVDRFDDGSESLELETTIPPNEEITYPWWFGFGVAFGAKGLLVAGDIRYSDWREMKDKVAGTEFFLRPYYKETASVSLGAEYLFPSIPLRVRAGYRYEPVPFNLTYVPLAGELVLTDGRDPAEVDVELDGERDFFSLGAGYLFGAVMTVDLAGEPGGFDRAHLFEPDLYNEKRTSSRLIGTASYRF
ncbi:MAG: hypothetical protein HKN20_10560, partial [Gemmatimonadetes bacterium]|nr:hypothetical protein [Gemmatimonadota bacterium]